MNDNGERLCDLCSPNGLVVTGTLFLHKEIHKLTARSLGGKTVNQNDHVVPNGRILSKLARVERKEKGRQRFDVRKLQSEEIRRS